MPSLDFLTNISEEYKKFGVAVLILVWYFYIKGSALTSIAIVVIVVSLYVILKTQYGQKILQNLVIKFQNSQLNKSAVFKKYEIALGMKVITQSGWATLKLDEVQHVAIHAMTQFGKSTLLNTLIYQIAMTTDPSEVKIALHDPKKNAFTLFERLPHLYMPVKRKGESLVFLKEIYNEMNKRNAAFNMLAGTQHKIESLKDYEKHLQENDHPSLPMFPRLYVVIDEVSVVNDIPQCRELLENLFKQAAGSGIHLIVASHRATVGNLSGDALSEISTEFVGHLKSNREYAYAGVPKEHRDKIIHEPGYFVALIKGMWYYIKVTEIPDDILKRNMMQISIPVEEVAQTGTTIDITTVQRKALKGSREEKRAEVFMWMVSNNFKEKPSYLDLMREYEISQVTARNWVNDVWPNYSKRWS